MTFGTELKPNEFGSINGYVENQIEVYTTLSKLMNEKAAAEKEYGRKIMDLATGFQTQLEKLHDKKESSSTNLLALTDAETEAADPLLLLPAATEWALRLEEEGRVHMQLANKIGNEISEELRQAFESLVDARKKSLDFYQKLLSERDKVYDQKDKAKAHYESKSKALGQSQHRQERATTEKDQDKYRIKADKNTGEKNQAKNEYILRVSMSNAVKNAFNHKFTPRSMDIMQSINEQRIAIVKRMLLRALELQSAADTKRAEGTQRAIRVMKRVSPSEDTSKYIQQRIENGQSKWEEQPDFRVIVDYANGEADTMELDYESQVILKNLCLQADRDKAKAESELRAKEELETKYRQQAETGIKGSEKAIEKAAEAAQDATLIELEIVQQQALREAVEREMGPISGGNPHDFKMVTVALSKTCYYCGKSISGLNRKAAKCTSCDYICHAKCQIKAPPDCPGPGNQTKSGLLSIFGSKRGKHSRSESAVSNASERSSEPRSSASGSANMSSASLSQQNALVGGAAGQSLPRRGSAMTGTGAENGAVPGTSAPLSPRYATVSAASNAGAHMNNDTNAGYAAMGGLGGSFAAVMTGMNRTSASSQQTSALPSPSGGALGAGMPRGNAPLLPRRTSMASTVSTQKSTNATVMYDYEGDNITTLSIRAGDKIRVIESDTEGTGWMQADVHGHIGLVPTTYVQLDAGSPALSMTKSPGIDSMRLHSAMSTHQESQASNDFDGDAGDDAGDYVIALYAFEGRDSDELSFTEGDKILVTSRTIGAGWLKGTINGKAGRFPESYVREE